MAPKMEGASYLTFRLHGSLYAVDATAVIEIVPLPEVSRLEETPTFIAGIANLRGRLVPVIDLNLRFGHPWQPYRLEQCLVILELDGKAMGLIVDAAETVHDFATEEIASASLYSLGSEHPDSRFIKGVIQSEGQIVMLLHLENLIGLSETLADQTRRLEVSAAFVSPDLEEMTLFQERSRRLAQPLDGDESAGLLPLAIVRIGDELFGIELKTIKEFAELRNATPVPCCPPHVVGQINLRGELITVLDIAKVLGLPASRDHANRKVVVMDDASLAGGVLVDELMDVHSLSPSDLSPIPHALRGSGQEHLRGAAMHETRMFSLIDLPALLMHGDLTVNETP